MLAGPFPFSARVPSLRRVRRTQLFVVLLAASPLAACSPDRGSDVRTWAAADHDDEEGPGAARQVPADSARAAGAGVDPSLVELSWAQKCASCHGPRGQGDGPNAAMYAAPDLTRDDLLGRVTDEELALTIRKGRGKMPAFDLPPSVVEGLVKRIRGKGRVQK